MLPSKYLPSHPELFVLILSISRYMPPTTPVGIPCVAIVFARTMVNGEDHGIKPFVVNLHNGQEMMAGIVSKYAVIGLFNFKGLIFRI